MRNTKTVVITQDGRDKGKRFLLTEKSAWDTERWAIRALQVAVRAGVEMPEGMDRGGAQALYAIAGTAALRIMAMGDVNEALALVSELHDCIQIVRDPSRPEAATFPIMVETDIEEISTLVELQREVVMLHVGFLPQGSTSNVNSASGPGSSSSNTQMSPRRSVRPSPRKPPL